jgi:hypothetical protein
MALVRGQIVPVLTLGEAKGTLIVGRVRGEVVGLAGLEVVDFEFLDVEDLGCATGRENVVANGYPSYDATTGCPASAGQIIDVEALIAANRLQDRSTSQPSQETT